MFSVYCCDEKKQYLACDSPEFAEKQGGTWEEVMTDLASFDLAMGEALTLAQANPGYVALGGCVVSPPEE